MNLKTKFDLDQDVYILFNNKIYEVCIKSIDISIERGNLSFNDISYLYHLYRNPAGSQLTTRFIEHELFESKEELAGHLINNS